MRSASSVKSRALALAGILVVWTTIAFAQEEPVEQQEPVTEESTEQSTVVVPRAPLRLQLNTLCDTSYSRMTNCDERKEEVEQEVEQPQTDE